VSHDAHGTGTDRGETTAATSTQPFQIEVEREEGFRVEDGQVKPWQGWRVKYRPLGSRGRWAKFVTDDDLARFGIAELQEFCRLHEERAS